MSAQDCPLYIGVDVAKLSLAIHFPDQVWSTANSAKGLAVLVTRLKALGPTHVICEATGGYERSLLLALHEAGLPVSMINPRQVRDFARACGRLAKTDAIDASLLSRYGAALHPPPDPAPTTGSAELAELVRARQEVVALSLQIVTQFSRMLFVRGNIPLQELIDSRFDSGMNARNNDIPALGVG